MLNKDEVLEVVRRIKHVQAFEHGYDIGPSAVEEKNLGGLVILDYKIVPCYASSREELEERLPLTVLVWAPENARKFHIGHPDYAHERHDPWQFPILYLREATK